MVLLNSRPSGPADAKRALKARVIMRRDYVVVPPNRRASHVGTRDIAACARAYGPECAGHIIVAREDSLASFWGLPFGKGGPKLYQNNIQIRSPWGPDILLLAPASKRNLTFNLLDPDQIRLTLCYTNYRSLNCCCIRAWGPLY